VVRRTSRTADDGLDTSSEGKSSPGTLLSLSVILYQIWCESVQKWRSYGRLTDFKNGGRRHLGFLHYVNFDSKSVCGTPFSASVSNLVQMRAIIAELWPKM